MIFNSAQKRFLVIFQTRVLGPRHDLKFG